LEASEAVSREERREISRGRRGKREKRTDAFEDVVDERVEDEHGFVGDPSVGVDLLEDLVDVGRASKGESEVSEREEK
jgi:hypothetical protein